MPTGWVSVPRVSFSEATYGTWRSASGRVTKYHVLAEPVPVGLLPTRALHPMLCGVVMDAAGRIHEERVMPLGDICAVCRWLALGSALHLYHTPAEGYLQLRWDFKAVAAVAVKDCGPVPA